jgi:hypothetical protein
VEIRDTKRQLLSKQQRSSFSTLDPSRFPGDPRKKAAREGGLFALDFADYLYISGFSMVSTFRN